MIIPEQGNEKSGSRTHEEAPAQEQPPPYDEPTNDAGGSAPPRPSSSTLPTPAATNHVSVAKRHGEIVGAWVIDPRIQGPPNFLSPRDEGPRKNFHVETHNGALSLDVTVVPSEGDSSSSGRTVALLEAHTIHGAVKFNLHDALGQNDLVRLPVKVTVTSHNGAIYVRLPRSFRGVINAGYSWGSVQLSEDVAKQVRYSKEENWMKRLFVGEFDASDFSLTTWAGDEVNAQTRRGNVCFSYEDEAEAEGESAASLFRGKSILSTLRDVVLSRVTMRAGALPRR